MSQPTVFVCGVTGTQGGSVARNLLVNNIQVHAIARDTASPNALAVQSLGVELWTGDFDNPETLAEPIKGCFAVFLNLNPDLVDKDGELRRAKGIINVAKQAGIKHLIYSSSFSVEEPGRFTHWDPNSLMARALHSKQAIESETSSAGFDYWTILRPGNFMSNFIQPMVRLQTGLVEHGRWSSALQESTRLPLVDPDTIGKFACTAFMNPAKFGSQEIEIMDEFLVPSQVLQKLSAATGRDLQPVYMSDEEIKAQKATNPFIMGQLLMRDMAQFVDLDKIKSWGIPLSSFDAFIEREKKRVNETYLQQ
ncbi:NmrA-like family domain-containing oxidoreductase ptmS-like protein [Cladobotryum mycophilum]|uniref:NmrA-like family domain-containing oxidoreductase ptmS-like protein n=1 Tax=Cladobotryum mycophilum TaxID=491253 RepID=A0ABR0SG67_9HYPO